MLGFCYHVLGCSLSIRPEIFDPSAFSGYRQRIRLLGYFFELKSTSQTTRGESRELIGKKLLRTTKADEDYKETRANRIPLL